LNCFNDLLTKERRVMGGYPLNKKFNKVYMFVRILLMISDNPSVDRPNKL